jgi:hypothetical protein
MDLAKIDRLYQALSTDFFVLSTEEAATPSESLTVALRLFSYLLAAYVAGADLPRTALRSAIEAQCRDAAALARSRLLELRGYEPFEAAEDEAEPG